MTTYEELREMALKAEEAAAYWKARAEKAEAMLRGVRAHGDVTQINDYFAAYIHTGGKD